MLYREDGETLAQAAHRGGRCPIPGNISGQVGWGSEHPDSGEDVPAHCRGVGLGGLERSLPTQTILRFHAKEVPSGAMAGGTSQPRAMHTPSILVLLEAAKQPVHGRSSRGTLPRAARPGADASTSPPGLLLRSSSRQVRAAALGRRRRSRPGALGCSPRSPLAAALEGTRPLACTAAAAGLGQAEEQGDLWRGSLTASCPLGFIMVSNN